MKYLFLDTNIWLHFRRVEDYSIEELSLGTELMVIVPDIILHELDDKKDGDRNARIKDSARHVTKCIKVVSKKEGMQSIQYFRNKIGLGYFMHTPEQKDVDVLGLRSNKNDGIFLASIIDFSKIKGIALSDI